jgi:transcriptional regulator with XRE-family HTH domain
VASGGKGHIDDPRRLGQRVVRSRGSLSQRELADAVGVSPAYISRIERGERVPSLQLVERVARALGVDVGWLRGESSFVGKGKQRAQPISAAAIAAELKTIEGAIDRIRRHIDA